MAGGKNHLRGGHSSIKYSWDPVEKSSSELTDFPREEYASDLTENVDKKCWNISNSKTPEILSTAELISAVGQIWDYASRPLASFLCGVNSNPNSRDSKNEVIVGGIDGEGNEILNSSATRASYFCVDLRNASQCPSQTQTASNFVEVTEKKKIDEEKAHTPFRKLLQGRTKKHEEPWRPHGFTSMEISCELENVYGWMKQIAFPCSNSRPKASDDGKRANAHCGSQDTISSLEGSSVAGEGISSATILASTVPDSNSRVTKSCNLPSLKESKSEVNARPPLYFDYFLTARHEADTTLLTTPVSDLYKEYCLSPIVDGASEDSESSTDDNQQSDPKSKKHEVLLVAEDSSKNQADRKPRFSFAKQEHAFAGAFAGIFVSLCLHPVDTVKTVIQSCRADQRSVFYIGRLIVAERGLTGLYRGITTNIASSAPISAMYTYTYESVKGALLPHLPKEYHSFAHCVAGGCASVATSFVFTPSERIKQQMQVGSHYNNCWNALVGILQNGGWRSLYNGWGAVLCRNVPHSIIKFYTYESLKRLTSSPSSPSSQPNTLQTLFCGGLAGSTAAFFTTPFDVVKTRLQTQVPGAMSEYNGVTRTLIEIGKNEGLKGLYSGLTPRLVMYVSQGALFFASYEFFKKFLALETPLPETDSVGFKENNEENSFIPTPQSAVS